ncbi:hypothetical protein ILFOPFJJ_05457 [Ensifer psoraleae]|nr:hypothetical protein [Sinorhizobium psoraleae]
MRTLRDEIEAAVAVDLAVLEPHQRRAYAGLDQYRRPVEVRGVQELARKIAESFGAFAIFDVGTVLRRDCAFRDPDPLLGSDRGPAGGL